jgi:lipoprotein-releasing system ATP-binding protein
LEIAVDRLSKTYAAPSGPIRVLDDLSFSVPSGGALAVTGPSGCGKSTLLHILGTLEPPTSGSVRLGTVDPLGLTDRELSAFRNRSIGFVFQDHYLLPQLDVIENVLVPSVVARSDRRHGGSDGAASIIHRARELLDRVGLASRADHRPAQISGGEKQRAALARALLLRPGLLLCDEPTGNLDVENAARIAELLLDLQSSEGVTLVIVTHSESLAERIPERLRLGTARAKE